MTTKTKPAPIVLRNLTGHPVPIAELTAPAEPGRPAGTLILAPHEARELTRDQLAQIEARNRQRGAQPGWSSHGLARIEA